MATPEFPFFRTQDSDEWVNQSIKLSQEYSRVLMVTQDANPPGTVSIAPLDLNARVATDAPKREYKIAKTFRTLQEAADASQGGDLIVVAPGEYAGFHITSARPGAADGKYVHFKALGNPGDVTINQINTDLDQRWMVLFSSTHHIIFEGFHLDGSAYVEFKREHRDTTAPSWPAAAETHPGFKGPRVDWSGITLGSNFENTATMAHHLIILNNFSHDHCKWGMVTADTHSVLLQGNVFANSREEHGAYVSDGSDNYCIRRNIFFGNSGCGMQCNLDPQCSLFATAASPPMKHFPKPAEPFGPWSRDLIAEATKVFGQYMFPDGRGVNFIIEENVANQNNRLGGGAFNFSGVQQSVIQNNLLYDNLAHGLSLYNQYDPFDKEIVMAGFSSPDQITGSDVLPFFGSHSNLVRNNTVLMNAQGRAAALCVSGSYATTFRNNIFINDADDSTHIDSHSLWHTDSANNVIGRAGYSGINPDGYWSPVVKNLPTPLPPEFKSVAIHLDEQGQSALNITREKLAPQFVRDSNEPWIIIEGKTWRLNPNRPDFRPREDSSLLQNKAERKSLPARDNTGKQRTTADIGAFAR